MTALGKGLAEGGKVHYIVARTLGSWILAGRYKSGEVLLREDVLATWFNVGRTSVRQAVKVLCAKGMLETRQRVGVRVRDRADWRMLDPAVLSWHPNLSADIELVSGLLEARRIIEPAAADLAAIGAAYLGMEAAIPHDMDLCCDADLAFHRGTVAASHNIVR